MYYINVFFLYAILGHLMETTLVPTFNSGILFGWWTPVYGVGAVLIILIGKLIDKIPLEGKRICKVIITYVISMVVLSLIEVMGGYLIEFIFKEVFWNYEDHHFNIGPYISLEMANIWGIASIFLLYILKPITDFIVKKIPSYITWILIIIFCIDVTAKLFTHFM